MVPGPECAQSLSQYCVYYPLWVPVSIANGLSMCGTSPEDGLAGEASQVPLQPSLMDSVSG